jgi:hypothetical protein
VREAGANWLDDPLDPRLIARRRRGVYLRHAALMMVRNLLDWADHEFAQEDAESVDRARQLYLLARRALDAPEFDRCDAAIRTLEIDMVMREQAYARPDRGPVRHAIRRLSGIRQRAVLDEAVTKVRNLAESMHGGKLAKAIDKVVTQALRDDARRTPKSSWRKRSRVGANRWEWARTRCCSDLHRGQTPDRTLTPSLDSHRRGRAQARGRLRSVAAGRASVRRSGCSERSRRGHSGRRNGLGGCADRVSRVRSRKSGARRLAPAR